MQRLSELCLFMGNYPVFPFLAGHFAKFSGQLLALSELCEQLVTSMVCNALWGSSVGTPDLFTK